MDLELKGKRVWISGAGSGIGGAAAKAFAREGSDLILLGRREKALKETEALIKKEHPSSQVATVPLDLTDADKVAAHFEDLPPIDVAINNAAFEGSRRSLAQEATLAEYDEIFNINVRALFQCQSFQIRKMHEHGIEGAIVNISSMSAYKAIPGSSLYCASKAAIVALSRVAALEEIQNGIRINIVAPGGTETDMLQRIYPDLSKIASFQPSKRLSTPEEIAEGILWMASSKASHVMGHQLVIDGGATL